MIIKPKPKVVEEKQTPISDDIDIKPAMKEIKKATGITDIKDVLSKMERHSQTMQSLADVQK